jgi:putative transposase
MQRVERHIIVNNKRLDELTHLSKNLYNYVNYMVRQHFIKTGQMLGEYDITTQLAKEDQYDFRQLNSNTSQQTVKLLFKSWKSFFKAIKDYKKHPQKYKSRPNLPKYKKKSGHFIVVFTANQAKLKEEYIHFPKKTNLKPLKTEVDNVKQVRIVPQTNCNVIEVIYEKQPKKTDVQPDRIMSVDIGLSNFATCVDNTGNRPFIVNGKPLKSMNQYFNKLRAEQMSYVGNKGTSKRLNKLIFKRNNKVNDYIHKTSRYIIDYAIEHKIGKIIIGNNKGWKQNCNIGKRNNQNFVSIPYFKLIGQLKYKAEDESIECVVREESYTSKCDALAKEEIKKHDDYLGRRHKRGLFSSSTGRKINADVNGAINIARKEVGEMLTASMLDRGIADMPVRITPDEYKTIVKPINT